jgi:hypothetical protein
MLFGPSLIACLPEGDTRTFYWESTRNQPGADLHAGRIELPMAATIFPRDYYRAPRAWAEALWPKLFYWNEVDRGGHFAAWEQPDSPTRCARRSARSEPIDPHRQSKDMVNSTNLRGVHDDARACDRDRR